MSLAMQKQSDHSAMMTKTPPQKKTAYTEAQITKTQANTEVSHYNLKLKALCLFVSRLFNVPATSQVTDLSIKFYVLPC